MDSAMATWLTLEELAQYLKKPKSSLYKLLRKQQLPGHKVGRTYRFDQDEIDAWIKASSLPEGQAKPRNRQ
jgi:excisionase family DNA binding protein